MQLHYILGFCTLYIIYLFCKMHFAVQNYIQLWFTCINNLWGFKTCRDGKYIVKIYFNILIVCLTKIIIYFCTIHRDSDVKVSFILKTKHTHIVAQCWFLDSVFLLQRLFSIISVQIQSFFIFFPKKKRKFRNKSNAWD